jgi:hypothetical protein
MSLQATSPLLLPTDGKITTTAIAPEAAYRRNTNNNSQCPRSCLPTKQQQEQRLPTKLLTDETTATANGILP